MCLSNFIGGQCRRPLRLGAVAVCACPFSLFLCQGLEGTIIGLQTPSSIYIPVLQLQSVEKRVGFHVRFIAD